MFLQHLDSQNSMLMMPIRYKYFYWFAFPAFVSKPAWEISESGWSPVTNVLTADAVRYPLRFSFLAIPLDVLILLNFTFCIEMLLRRQ
jgi:hypothetical protein